MTITVEEFMRTATTEQKQLLFDLSDLAKKENEIAGKINRIYDTVKYGIGVHEDETGITLCEDEDDANVISSGLRHELNSVRNQISELLKKAVSELGMSEVGIIQRQYKNYVENKGG